MGLLLLGGKGREGEEGKWEGEERRDRGRETPVPDWKIEKVATLNSMFVTRQQVCYTTSIIEVELMESELYLLFPQM